jgi:hypothetical protein
VRLDEELYGKKRYASCNKYVFISALKITFFRRGLLQLYCLAHGIKAK